MKIFEQLIKNDIDNYILPFFWQRNESETIICEYMHKIRSCGINQVCLESRPHPDFCSEKWWRDLDVIFEEADRLDMKVWLLDDNAFPTGNANGKSALMPTNLKKSFLHLKQFDIVGPKKSAHFILKPDNVNDVLSYVSAIAVRVENIDGSVSLTNNVIDVLDFVYHDKLWLDIPEGNWKIFVVYEKQGKNDRLDNLINPLIAESVDVLINEVYEKHYHHYSDRFGKSFAGFFSDEPDFYNVIGAGKKLGYDLITRLPWSANMPIELEQEYGTDWRINLPFLWLFSNERSSRIRYSYMNTLTKLYEKNFSRRIGDWCKKHNVEYIGHIVEDDNTHGRLAIGAGHFFRALSGQDMSGIDVVLNQLLPDLDYQISTYHNWDGEFFHYALAKLASSFAVIDSSKENRSLCEIFGAYGWCEGLRLMKWLADHMLIRGINYFVPHAFSMAEFPDKDCPPHFYARGNNPQFKYFNILINYINRISRFSIDGQKCTRPSRSSYSNIRIFIITPP